MTTAEDNKEHTNTNKPLDRDAASSEAKDAIIKVLRGSGAEDAFYIVQSVNDFLHHVGREASRQRQQQYIEPFKCEDSDVEDFHNVVKRILLEFGVYEERIFFDCNIGLRNRRVIACHSVSEVKNAPEADKSRPVSVEMSWTYFYPIQWRELSLPMPFKVAVEYSTELRKDITGVMSVAAAPEQCIDVSMEGPSTILASLNEEVDAIIRRTFLPIWWRYPKKALQWFEPYIGIAIYGAAISTAVVTARKFGLEGGKTDAEMRAQYIAKRDQLIKEHDSANQTRKEILQQIINAPNVSDKLDAYASYMLKPLEPIELKSVEDVFNDDGGVLPYIGYLFMCLLAAGLLHILFIQVYKRLAPPSIIVLGKLWRERLKVWRIYDVFAWFLFTTVAVPIALFVIRVIQLLFAF